MGEGRDIRVATFLSAEEFLLLRSMATAEGLSDSAFIRRLVLADARRNAKN